MEWDDEIGCDSVFCFRESPLALLVRLDDGREVWIPKSQISDNSEVFCEGQRGELVVSRWFAEKEDIG